MNIFSLKKMDVLRFQSKRRTGYGSWSKIHRRQHTIPEISASGNIAFGVTRACFYIVQSDILKEEKYES
jgi:hypothetical protein